MSGKGDKYNGPVAPQHRMVTGNADDAKSGVVVYSERLKSIAMLVENLAECDGGLCPHTNNALACIERIITQAAIQGVIESSDCTEKESKSIIQKLEALKNAKSLTVYPDLNALWKKGPLVAKQWVNENFPEEIAKIRGDKDGQ